MGYSGVATNLGILVMRFVMGISKSRLMGYVLIYLRPLIQSLVVTP